MKVTFEELLSPGDKIKLIQEKLDEVDDLLQDVRDGLLDEEIWSKWR